MTKIKSLDPNWASRDIILPIVGKVSFNDKCETEVKDAKTAEALVAIESLRLEVKGKSSGDSDDKKDVSKMNKTELIAEVVEMGRDNGEDLSDKKKADLIEIINTPQEEWDAASEEEEDEEAELSKEDKIAYINSLERMAELKELAAAFPEGEWSNIKSKAKLTEYLIGKVE